MTQKGWLWDNSDYAARGWIDLSWIDGNIRTINKDWIQVELYVTGASADNTVAVSYRTTDVSTETGFEWTALTHDATRCGCTESGSTLIITTSGIHKLIFSASSYSTRLQLRIYLTRGSTTTSTPIVHAVVLKYMERPRDVRIFTRTYQLSTAPYWRSGGNVQLSLAEQVTQLETLPESPEPLTWVTWFGKTYTVHITKYGWG